MIVAAHKNKKRLKAIKALDTHWKAFKQHPDALAMMIASMRHCEHFAAKVLSDKASKRTDGESQISLMMRNAPHIQITELAVNTQPFERLEKAAELSQLFFQEAHWLILFLRK